MSKNRITWFLEHEVVAGTIWWGQRKGKGTRPKDEWLALKVEPIIDAVTWALAQKLPYVDEFRTAVMEMQRVA